MPLPRNDYIEAVPHEIVAQIKLDSEGERCYAGDDGPVCVVSAKTTSERF